MLNNDILASELSVILLIINVLSSNFWLQRTRWKTFHLSAFFFATQLVARLNIPVIEKLTEARGVIVSAKAAGTAANPAIPQGAAAVTAKGDTADFVSRFFAPQSGISEDPVTGSAHTTLTPHRSAKLKKKKLAAIQLSPRRGYLECEDKGERIEISGIAKTFSSGHIFV